MVVQRKNYSVAGLFVNIYSDDSTETRDPGAPLSVVFLLHGRYSRALHPKVDSFAKELVEKATPSPRDHLVVTFDQRNHGTRLKDEMTNVGWYEDQEKHNPAHAVDMYHLQTGTANDVSYLIDFLPSKLYPNDEREIRDWGVIGISLGGHATWIVLQNEPRVTLGVPIIGCPDYIKLMSQRANSASVSFTPPAFPNSLRQYVEKHDPASSKYTAEGPENPFWGKNILVLSGAADDLVPWTCSVDFVNALQVGPNGVKQVFVQEGAGHVVSQEMMDYAEKFVLDWLTQSGNTEASR
ncbi:hypothetical protein FRC03_009449 [Tulasnella sp. 419]|nr:hypothetical protein FRC03_009449 [Tulasnella sp. 419]